MITRLEAFTLVETMMSMALIAVIFLLTMQAFNGIILGSYLVDARTSVRNEGEFVSEYLKLRLKNADPRSIVCDNTTAQGKPSISWQPLGASDTYTFYYDNSEKRFCIDNASEVGTGCDVVLTYNDVIVKDNSSTRNVDVTCSVAQDVATGQEYHTITLRFVLASTVLLKDRPAVDNVTRFLSVSVR